MLSTSLLSNTNMKFLVAFVCLLAAVAAKPGYLPLAYSPYHFNPYFNYGYYNPYSSLLHSAPIAYSYTSPTLEANLIKTEPAIIKTTAPAIETTVVKTEPLLQPIMKALPVLASVDKTQYHAQDILGQASYGHSEALQQHDAVQDAAGNKIGSYSYIAPNGQVFATNYIADGLGYRVTTNAMTAETPEVAAARAAHEQAHVLAKQRSRRDILTYQTHPTPTQYLQYAYAPLAYQQHSTLNTVVHNAGHPLTYHIE